MLNLKELKKTLVTMGEEVDYSQFILLKSKKDFKSETAKLFVIIERLKSNPVINNALFGTFREMSEDENKLNYNADAMKYMMNKIIDAIKELIKEENDEIFEIISIISGISMDELNRMPTFKVIKMSTELFKLEEIKQLFFR